MPPTTAEIEALLRERGYALTRRRRAIVRHLAQHGGHWSAAGLPEGRFRVVAEGYCRSCEG